MSAAESYPLHISHDAAAWLPDRLSQVVNAERLVHELNGRARFNVSAGMWMWYEDADGRFVPDLTGEVARIAKDVGHQTWTFVADPPPSATPKVAFKHAQESEKAAGIAAMMKLAQTELGISVTAKDFDAQTHLLNFPNCTFDFNTCLPRAHRRKDLLSKLAPVDYSYGATCPLFDAFLNRVMDGNAEMIRYLARIFGAAAATQKMQELYVFYGEGSNGKNVLLDTISGLLGDYASMAPESLLVTRSGFDPHPTDIASLCGKRFVVASETEQNIKLRIGLVKRLTGDAVITARFMRQDFFEFPRTHTLVLVTNNKPVINETSHAIWRRVRLVPFNVIIPIAERDTQLTEKLKAEWPGILNWLIAGYVDYRDNGGMQTPHEVLVATETYRAESDPLSDFLAERCVRGDKQTVLRTALRDEYVRWIRKAGEREPLDTTAFYDHIRRVPGVEEMCRRVGGKPDRVFIGIGLADLGEQYRQAQEDIQA